MFVNGKEIVKVEAKDSAFVATPLCLGNISKDWSTDNMKKTGSNVYDYEFNVHYRPFYTSVVAKPVSILQKYLMAKYNIEQNV